MKTTSNKTKRIGILVLLVILLVPLLTVSTIAADLNPFADKKIVEKTKTLDMPEFIKSDFNEKYGVIRLANTFFWVETSKIAEYSLTDNTEYCIKNCEANGKVILYEDGKLFDDINFNILKGRNIPVKNQNISIVTGTEKYEVEVPDKYKEVCEDLKVNDTNKEGGKVCTQEIDTYKKEERVRNVYSKYNDEVLRAGNYTWKINGQIEQDQNVDWIVTKNSNDFTEWATWNSSFNVGLILYYNGNTTTDLSGNNHLLIENGYAKVNNVSGIIPNSLYGNGSSGSFFNVTNSSLIEVKSSQGLTINFWLNTTFDSTTGAYKDAYIISSATALTQSRLMLYGNKPYVNTQGGSCSGNSDLNCGASCSAVNDGNWNMITIVMNATAQTVYQNGVYKISDAMASCNWNSTNYMALLTETPTTRNYKALVDEFSMWKRPLSADEITGLYNSGAGMTWKSDVAPYVAPNITLVSPVNFYNSTSSSVTFNCSVTQGTDLMNLTLIIDGAFNTTVFNTTSAQTNLSLQQQLTLADGSHQWSCNSSDLTQQNNGTTWNFTVDGNSPQINFTFPTPNDNSYLNYNSIAVNVTATDSNLANITVNLYNTFNNICYQETANASTVGDGSCNLNYSGSYEWINYMSYMDNPSFAFDGDWNTATDINCNPPDQTTNFIVNYTKPIGNINDAKLKVLWGNKAQGYINGTYAIPTNCRSSNVISVSYFNSCVEPGYNNISVMCFNGTDNELIVTNYSISVWTKFFEEAIYWNVSNLINSSNSTTSPLFYNFTNLADGTYYTNAIAWDTYGHSNSTETRQIDIDTVYPLVQLVPPTTATGEYHTLELVGNATASDSNFANLTLVLEDENTTTTTSTNLYLNYTSASFDKKNNVLYAIACDLSNNCNTTPSNTISIDTEYPAISYNSDTETNGTIIGRDNIFVNVTATKTFTGIDYVSQKQDFKIYLYNSTMDLINTSDYAGTYNADSITFEMNFTGLSAGFYYFNSSVNTSAGAVSYTDLRTVQLYLLKPQIDFVSPTPSNASYLNYNSIYTNLSIVSGIDAYQVLDFNRDLLGWWRLEELDNSSGYADSSSYGNNGSCTTSCPISSNGKFGMAQNFNGSNTEIILPTNSASNFGNKISTSAWFYLKPSTIINPKYILAVGSYNNTEAGFYLRLENTTMIRFVIGNGTARDIDTIIVPSITNNVWHNLIAVANGTSKLIYIDGILVGNDSYSISGNFNTPILANNHYIGSAVTASTVFNGSIDEVMIFNRTLSETEIKALYNSTYHYENNFTNLQDGTYNIVGSVVDALANLNQTQETLYVDTTLPQISITYPTATYYNATVTELNYTFLEINSDTCWYTLNNGATNTTITCGDNVTGITSTEGSNTWKVYINDSVNHINSSSVTFNVDTINPNATLLTPANNSYLNYSNVNFTANLSDTTTGVKNATINIYNTTGIVNITTTTYSPGIFSVIFDSIINLGDGAYNWFIDLFDWSGNTYQTENNTLVIDTIYPEVQFVSPTTATGEYSTLDILANATASDTNFRNLTITLLKGGIEFNTTTTLLTNLYLNYSPVLINNEVYTMNAVACDVNQCNQSTGPTVSLDTTASTIDYNSNTETNNSQYLGSKVFVNVTAEKDIAGVGSYYSTKQDFKIYLYNSTMDLINTSTYTGAYNQQTITLSENFTGLENGIYYFKSSINTTAGAYNETLLRKVTTSNITPDIQFNLPTPLNNSYLNINYILANLTSLESATNFLTMSLYNSTGLINSTNSSSNNNFLCYQEYANVSTTCGGLNSGSYSILGQWVDGPKLIDGNWNTNSTTSDNNGYMYVTYTKPFMATNSSLWGVKDENSTTNLTIPEDCWNYNDTQLLLSNFNTYLDTDLLVNGTEITLYGNQVYDNVRLMNGGNITILPKSSDPNAGTLTFTVSGDITIDTGSYIKGTGSGAPAGNNNNAGFGAGGAGGAATFYCYSYPHPVFAGGGGAGGYSTGGAGAGAGDCGEWITGGSGGVSGNVGSNVIYGAGGGAVYRGASGGLGGGALYLNANNINLKGGIIMAGTVGNRYYNSYYGIYQEGAGGSAAGNVYIRATGILNFTGLITANGGDGAYGPGGTLGAGGGGSGGLVNISANVTYNSSASINVAGGGAGGAGAGGGGSGLVQWNSISGLDGGFGIEGDESNVSVPTSNTFNCYNGTQWKELRKINTTDALRKLYSFEEGMNWNISYTNTVNNIFYNFLNLAEGIYYLNGSATTVYGITNYSETRTITIDTIYPTINFTSPTEINGSVINRFNILVNVTSVDTNLANITINLYDVNSSLINSTTGTSSPLFVNFTNLSDGIYYFNAIAYDYSGNSNQTETRQVDIDTTAPSITIYDPTNYKIYNNKTNLPLLYLIHDEGAHIDKCWFTTTPNGGAESANSYLPCTTNSTYNLTSFGIEYLLKVYANDSVNNIYSTGVNVTAVNSSYGIIYNTFSFEFTSNTFNATVQQSNNVSTVGTLYYNGAAYSTTQTSNGGLNNFVGTVTTPPTTGSVNYTFYYQYDYTWNGATYSYNNTIRNQTVWEQIFALCNSTISKKTLNLTFRDETTNLPMAANIDAMTITYANGNKVFYFSNTTNNTEYDFCIYPNFLPNTTALGPIQYSATGYPQRKTTLNNVILTNSTITHYDLYLLSSTAGIYSTIQVVTPGTQVIPGAFVTVQRIIGPITTTIADGFTDGAGTITFWLNPNYDHIITVSKAGYTTQSVTIRPTQAFYTITMSGQGNDLVYNSPLQGIIWNYYPASGGFYGGMTNFTMRVNPGLNNMTNCTMIINYPNGTALATVTGGNASGCSLNVGINTTYLNELYGQFYLNMNGSIYALERDAHWRRFDPGVNNSNFLGTYRNAVNMSMSSDMWGTGCDSGFTLNTTDNKCYNGAGVVVDKRDTADYSRIVFFFFMFALFAALINYYTGYDTAYPGALLLVFMFAVGLLTFVNGFFGPGWFYLNMFNVSNSIFGWYFAWANNTMFFFFSLLLAVAYWFTTMRRYQS